MEALVAALGAMIEAFVIVIQGIIDAMVAVL